MCGDLNISQSFLFESKRQTQPSSVFINAVNKSRNFELLFRLAFFSRKLIDHRAIEHYHQSSKFFMAWRENANSVKAWMSWNGDEKQNTNTSECINRCSRMEKSSEMLCSLSWWGCVEVMVAGWGTPRSGRVFLTVVCGSLNYFPGNFKTYFYPTFYLKAPQMFPLILQLTGCSNPTRRNFYCK